MKRGRAILKGMRHKIDINAEHLQFPQSTGRLMCPVAQTKRSNFSPKLTDPIY